jgi:hypothetical protein
VCHILKRLLILSSLVYIRSEHTAKADRDEIKNQLRALESAVQRHIELIKKEQEDAQRRKEDFKEEPEDEEDGGAQRTLALKEVEEQFRLLKVGQASSEAVLSHVQRERTGQKIKGVKATDDGIAVAGFINTLGDIPSIDQDISDVTAAKASFAGAGVIMGLNFKDLSSSSDASQRN